MTITNNKTKPCIFALFGSLVFKKCNYLLYLSFLFFCHCSAPLTKNSLNRGIATHQKKKTPNSESYEEGQKLRMKKCNRKALSINVTAQERVLFEKICYSIYFVMETDWVSDEKILIYLTTIQHARLPFLKQKMHPEFSTFLLRSLASKNETERLTSCIVLDRLLLDLSKNEYKQYVSNYIKSIKYMVGSLNTFFKGKTSSMLVTAYVWSLINRAITDKRIPLSWKYEIREQVYSEHRSGNISVVSAYDFFKKNE